MYLIAIGALCQWRGRWEWETLVGGGKALGWGLFVDRPLGSRLASSAVLALYLGRYRISAIGRLG